MGLVSASDRMNPPVPTDEQMGYRSCGCDDDYHYADCPIRKHDLEAQEPEDDWSDYDSRKDGWK